MRAADRQHEQHRVQPYKGGGKAWRAPELAGRARGQRHCDEASRYGYRLHRPQSAGEPERRNCIAPEREQRPVGRVLEGPADEGIDRVGGRLGGDVRVRVKPMQGTHAGEAEVAKHVLGDQRRAEQQHDMRGDDPPTARRPRERARDGSTADSSRT